MRINDGGRGSLLDAVQWNPPLPEDNPGLWQRLLNAKDVLLSPVEIPTDPAQVSAYLPNETLAGYGALKSLGALGEITAPPTIARTESGQKVQVDPLMMGSIKPGVKWSAQRELLAGTDPTRLSMKDYGRVVKELNDISRIAKSPDEGISNLWLMLNGARMRDKFDTSDPKKIIELMGKERGLTNPPPVRVFSGEGPLSSEQIGMGGSYRPKRVGEPEIQIIQRNLESIQPRNLDHMVAGVSAHEGQHWIEDMIYPDFRSTPEIIGTAPVKDSFELQDAARRLLGRGDPNIGFYSDRNFNDVREWLKKNHYTPKKGDDHYFPYTSLVMSKIAEAGGPQNLKNAKELLEQAKYNDLKKIYLNSQLGGDPYLAQRMKSYGHMKEYNAFEPEFSQIDLAAQNARMGGEVHPDLMQAPAVKAAIQAYESPIKKGSYFVPEKGPNLWQHLAAGAAGLVTGLGPYFASKMGLTSKDDAPEPLPSPVVKKLETPKEPNKTYSAFKPSKKSNQYDYAKAHREYVKQFMSMGFNKEEAEVFATSLVGLSPKEMKSL